MELKNVSNYPQFPVFVNCGSDRNMNSEYGKLFAYYQRSMGTVPQCRLRGSSEPVPVCFIFRIAVTGKIRDKGTYIKSL